MYKDDFYALVKNMQEEEQDILFRKGHDYQCGSDDVLANFKRIAERLSLSPLEVWAVYFLKHIDAILTFVKKGEVASEDIEGRFNDARNYLYRRGVT
ncbi:MAG: hypothetical protein DRH51_06665 [Candidatus Coatesbacteria bacterium]|nr:MAG: hypothetical protein DRH51_06665 [Candidatus Coatesbacteria bacterium]